MKTSAVVLDFGFRCRGKREVVRSIKSVKATVGIYVLETGKGRIVIIICEKFRVTQGEAEIHRQ